VPEGVGAGGQVFLEDGLALLIEDVRECVNMLLACKSIPA